MELSLFIINKSTNPAVIKLYAQWPCSSCINHQLLHDLVRISSITNTPISSSHSIATLPTPSISHWLTLSSTTTTTNLHSLLQLINSFAQFIFGHHVWQDYNPETITDPKNQLLTHALNALLTNPNSPLTLGLEHVPCSANFAYSDIQNFFSTIETVSQLETLHGISPNPYAMVHASSILLMGSRILASSTDADTTQVLSMVWIVINRFVPRDLAKIMCRRQTCLGNPGSTCAEMTLYIANSPHHVLIHQYHTWTLITLANPPKHPSTYISIQMVLCPHMPKSLKSLGAVAPTHLSPTTGSLVNVDTRLCFHTSDWPTGATDDHEESSVFPYTPISVLWPKQIKSLLMTHVSMDSPGTDSVNPIRLCIRGPEPQNRPIPLPQIGFPAHILALTRYELSFGNRTVSLNKSTDWALTAGQVRDRLQNIQPRILSMAIHVMPPPKSGTTSTAPGIWIHGINQGQQIITVFAVTDDEPTDAMAIHTLAQALV